MLGLTLGMDWKPVPPGELGIDAITRELTSVDGAKVVASLSIAPGLLFGGAKGRPEQPLGTLTLATPEKEPATFDRLEPFVGKHAARTPAAAGPVER